MFRITTLATIVFCAAHLAVAAQEVPCTEWTRTWDPGGGDSSTGGRIAVAPDGSVYTTGRVGESGDDIVLIKYDKSGKTLWLTTYDGPVSGNDEPTDIEVTDEGVSLVGTSPDERGPATVLLDFDHDGALIREQRTIGPAIAGFLRPQLAIGIDGRRVIASDDGAGTSVVEAYGNDGSLIFANTFSLNGFSGVSALAVNTDLDVFVVMVADFNRYVVRKFDAAGQEQWSHEESFTGLVLSEAFITTIGSDVVVAGSGETPCISPKARVWRHSSDGTVQWTRELPVQCTFAIAVGLSAAPNGGVYLAVRGEFPQSFLAQLDAGGNVSWVTSAGGDGFSVGFTSLATSATGNAIVGSSIAPELAFLELDVLMQSYDENGQLVWSEVVAGPEGEPDFINQVAAGSDGTVAGVATLRQGVPFQNIATLGFPSDGCTGDLDGDGDVDSDDWAAFAGCMTGPDAGGVEPPCGPADGDNDNDVDLADTALFLTAFAP